MRRRHAPLAAIVALAALLRFYRIDHQSFHIDEVNTATGMGRPLGDLWDFIADQAGPPLYFVLAWVWAQVLGTGEAALRSLSALAGVTAVAVVYLAGRELFSHRAGLVAALLVAVNPYLVWYSQEARPYSLLVLLAALSVLAWARALSRPSGRRLALWAAVAVLAVLTHYFAAFLVVPEGAWLLWRLRDRRAAAALGAVGLAGLALVPLAREQVGRTLVDYIGGVSLRDRLTPINWKLFGSEHETTLGFVVPVSQLIALAAIAFAIYRLRGGTRRNELLLIGLAVAVVAIPLALEAAGAEYVLARNLITLAIPLLLAIAAGLAAARAAGMAGAALLAVAGVAVVLQVAHNPHLQRDDWRGAAQALGTASEPRAVVVSPWFNDGVLARYAGPLPPFPAAGAPVREVDVVLTDRGGGAPEWRPPPGFAPAGYVREPSFVLIRYRAPDPVHVTPAELGPAAPGPQPLALVQYPAPMEETN